MGRDGGGDASRNTVEKLLPAWLTGFIGEKPFYILRTRIASTRCDLKGAPWAPSATGSIDPPPSSSSSPAPVPRKSGGRNKATGNRPSGTLAWWWRHLVPLGAEFYGRKPCTHCSCSQVARRCGPLSPRLPFITPFTFFLAFHVNLAGRVLWKKSFKISVLIIITC